MPPSQLIIRHALATDRAALHGIAARTPDAGDEMMQGFAQWLADSNGQFLVATTRLMPTSPEKLVGMVKLSRLANAEWWLHGLGVDPDYYGQGVGRALIQYVTAWLANTEAKGLVRFIAGQANKAVKRLAMETGFKLKFQFTCYTTTAKANDETAKQFRPLTPTDQEAVQAFLENSVYFAQAEQNLMVGPYWQARLLSEAYLADLLNAGSIYGWFGRRQTNRLGDLLHPASPTEPAGSALRLGGLVVAQPAPASPPEGPLLLSYLDATMGNFALVASASRALASKLGYQTLSYMLLGLPERLVAIEQSGWRRPTSEETALLYSKRL
jgi:GNAT superfamily N-acetyltransferase